MDISNLLNSSEFDYFNTALNRTIAQLEDEIMRVDPRMSEKSLTPHDVNRELRNILILLRDKTEDIINNLATAGSNQELGQAVLERIRADNDHSKHRKDK